MCRIWQVPWALRCSQLPMKLWCGQHFGSEDSGVAVAAEECSIVELTSEIDKKSGKKSKKKPMFVKSGAVITCVIETEQNVCLEPFDQCPQLGRFTLRDEGKTIGIGKVLATGVGDAAE